MWNAFIILGKEIDCGAAVMSHCRVKASDTAWKFNSVYGSLSCAPMPGHHWLYSCKSNLSKETWPHHPWNTSCRGHTPIPLAWNTSLLWRRYSWPCWHCSSMLTSFPDIPRFTFCLRSQYKYTGAEDRFTGNFRQSSDSGAWDRSRGYHVILLGKHIGSVASPGHSQIPLQILSRSR